MVRITARWLVTRVTILLSVIAVFQLVTYLGLDESVIRRTECSTPFQESQSLSTVAGRPTEKIECPTEKIQCPTLQTAQEPTYQDTTHKTSYHDSPFSKGERRNLAARLKRLTVELMETQRMVVTSLPVYHQIGQHVKSINQILESVHVRGVQNINSFNSGETRTTRNRVKENQEVCPEKFLGKNLAHGYPWFRTGFARVNCTNYKPLNKLISILIHLPVKQLKQPKSRTLDILRQIAHYYPGIKVHLVREQELSLDEASLISKLNISFVHSVDKSKVTGKIWSDLLRDVTTPYVLCTSDITHFTDDVNLERLIRELSTNTEVAIAGGSHRDQEGRWDIGCQQTLLRNWTMHHRGGYYYSFQDCVVCDYLSGPWAAKTDVLKQLGFDEKLDGGAFHDFFWRLKREIPSQIAVSCPDIMFNIHTQPVPDASYVSLADKWEIKKMVEPNGQVRWYGCRRGYKHTSGHSSSCSLTKGLGVPPCDLENLADAIKFVMKECEDAGMYCELQEGTLLGAVKLNKVLPWERDADITFLTANYTAFKKLRPKLEKQGYTLSSDDESLWCCVDGRQAGGKFRIGTSRFTIEMYGQHMMESELLVATGQKPTKVDFAGALVNVVRNPGLYARNRYGPNHFRHEEHWMDMGRETGWSFYNPGTFSKCYYPGHSACLDQYPADGNLQFSDYTTL